MWPLNIDCIINLCPKPIFDVLPKYGEHINIKASTYIILAVIKVYGIQIGHTYELINTILILVLEWSRILGAKYDKKLCINLTTFICHKSITYSHSPINKARNNLADCHKEAIIDLIRQYAQ